MHGKKILKRLGRRYSNKDCSRRPLCFVAIRTQIIDTMIERSMNLADDCDAITSITSTIEYNLSLICERGKSGLHLLLKFQSLTLQIDDFCKKLVDIDAGKRGNRCVSRRRRLSEE